MNKKKRFIKAVHKHLMYTLSLPERTIRSLAALAGGTTTLLTEILFPEFLRNTTIYNVSFGMMQRFIVERVAGIESETNENQINLDDDYVQRKMAGTALEAAGLLAMRFSPLWVFAIAGDVAGGSKVFLKRLVKHLKENNIIAQEAEASELVDVKKEWAWPWQPVKQGRNCLTKIFWIITGKLWRRFRKRGLINT